MASLAPRRLLLTLSMIVTLAISAASAASAALTLAAEVSPDPVQSNELIDVQISIASTSATGNLTLRMVWPAELDGFPVVTGGGSCPGGSCSTGEFLTWNLGSIGPGANLSVGFNETADSGLANGTSILLDIDLLENGALAQSLSLTVEVQADSPLELAVDPLADPVASSGLLVYEVAYGNNGIAAVDNAELSLPLPAGTSFVSATGGGVLAGNTVSWDLDSLPPNSGGRERVTVQVGAVGNGTLLVVDTATVSGNVNFQPRQSRAMAVSRVAAEALELAAEIYPDPILSNSLLDAQISIANSTASTTGTLTLRMLWPPELDGFPVATNGGTCPGGSCSSGEYLSWNLGLLGPGITTTVGFSETADSGLAGGTLLPLEFELLEAGLPARNFSHTVLIENSPLELAVDPLTDPVEAGDFLIYELTYGNKGTSSADNAVLSTPLPPGTQFVSATGNGMLTGTAVSWDLTSIPPNSWGRERMTVKIAAVPVSKLLLIDAASVSADILFQPRQSRAMAMSRIGSQAIELGAEIFPNPVSSNNLMDAQISVTNKTVATTGSLTLRLLWPPELDGFPITTSGGSCPGGSCSSGEYLSWNLGPLGPGVTATVGVNETADSGIASGTLMPLEFELIEGSLPARSLNHTVVVQSSPLELSVDPLSDPVVAGGSLIYELTYGNVGTATVDEAELSLPLPADSQFVAATGGGVAIGGSVRWNLGSLAPGSGGRERVTLAVDATPEAALLVVDAAKLVGDIVFQPRQTLAMAVSRIGPETAQLSAEILPDPAQPNALLTADINVTNPSPAVSGSLTLRMLWPPELDSFPVVTGGGSCPGGSCSSGEYLSWALGPLGPGASVNVAFNETVESGLADGTLIPLEIELLEAGLPARNRSQTVLVHPFTDNDEDGEADVFDEDDDNDGMPDWWEIENGLNPFDPSDADDDPDMDGRTNLQEFLAGTDPNADEQIFLDNFESGNTGAWS